MRIFKVITTFIDLIKTVFEITLLGAVCRPWNGRFSYSQGSVSGSPIEDDLSCTK